MCLGERSDVKLKERMNRYEKIDDTFKERTKERKDEQIREDTFKE
jgi:hypothetical protein